MIGNTGETIRRVTVIYHADTVCLVSRTPRPHNRFLAGLELASRKNLAMLHRLLAASLLSLLAVPFSFADTPLPRDPGDHFGTLPNGVKFIIRHNANPPGKVSMDLHVRTGALNETDQQNGLAHFIEHMAFNGSEHFKPGELMPTLNKLGMIFGADSNAHTSYQETVFKLTMPDTQPKEIDTALTIFHDYASGLLFVPKEIDDERGVILEESRSRKSAAERIQKEQMKKLFADSRLAIHDVIGDEDQIRHWQKDTFENYWNAWYQPENLTMIVVGDIDADALQKEIEAKFSDIKGRAADKPQQKAELKPTTHPAAYVFTDPEQVGCEVDLLTLRPPLPVTTTVDQYKHLVLQNAAQWIVNRRFADLIRKGGAPFRSANVDSESFFHEVQLVQGEAEGEPTDWNGMLDGLIAETSRAIDHGFQQRELELAKSDLISGAERAVQTESSRDSESVVAQLASQVGEQEPILSAQQRLDLIKDALASVTPDQLHQIFVDDFKGQPFQYTLTLPKSVPNFQQPSEQDVLAAASAAWSKKTQPLAEQQSATALLPSEPDPGKVDSQQTDDDLKITTVIFANGVVLHHKFNDYKKDTVMVSITLPGGAIEETAETKGLSDLASLILQRPATSRLTSTQIEDLGVGKNINVGGGIGLDTMSIRVAGATKDLPYGLQLAYALLTDSTLEQSAVDDWKKNMLQSLEQMKLTPDGQLSLAMEQTVLGNDLRLKQLTPEQVKGLQRASAEAWFKRIAGNAAIEVAVVGDLPLDKTVELVGKYLGALPKRTNSFESLDSLRTLRRDAGPFTKTVKFTSVTPKASVLAGFISCNQLDPQRRPLSLASLILTDRMTDRIREKEQLVYSMDCENEPGRAIPGLGMFIASAPTDPHNAERLGNEVIEMMKDFAAKGPSDEELGIAKKQVANMLDSQMKQPAFWLTNIAELNYRKRPLSDLKSVPGIFQTFTADQLRDTVRQYLSDQTVINLQIVPDSVVSTTQPSPQPEPMRP